MPTIRPTPTTTVTPPTTTATTAATATTTTTTTTATTATTATTPGGLDTATTTGPAPTATPIGTAVSGGISALASRLGAAGQPTGPALLELKPGLYPDAVSLTLVLKQLGNSPQAGAMVDGLAKEMKATLGVDVPPALLAAARANPDRVVDMLALTTAQMRGGFDALHAHHQVTSPQTSTVATNTKSKQLPLHTNTKKLDSVDIKRSEGDLKQLAPGLWRGDVKNAGMSDAAAKKNIVLAEIIDRLADNAGKPKAERFSVEHNGSRFTSLPHFITALQKDGYTVEAKITHRVADFFALKTQAPDGSFLDVPMAAMVKTGFKDKAGQEAVLPSVHSEVVFSIRAGANSTDPKLDGDIKWYQGVPNTGFFPCDTMRKSTWTGSTVAATIDASRGLEAITLCGVLGDVIQDASAKKNLAMSGYGVTGVCNDSVAIIQQAMTGTVTAYPLFMRDDVLMPEIAQRLKDTDRTDDSALKVLKGAIEAAPSDNAPNASASTRAQASIPWPAGKAPFASTDAARDILAAL